MATQPKYLVEIFWSEEDGGFIALAPDLPGCSAFGDTPQQAMNEMVDAMTSWLDACRRLGRPLPEPKTQPQREAA
jgi:antitoxin HicB